MHCHGFNPDFKTYAFEISQISSLVTPFENVIWDLFALFSAVLAYDSASFGLIAISIPVVLGTSMIIAFTISSPLNFVIALFWMPAALMLIPTLMIIFSPEHIITNKHN